MTLLFTPSGILEITIFFFAVLAFALAVRFFMESRRRLQESFPNIISPRKPLYYGFDRNGFLIPKSGTGKTADTTGNMPLQGGQVAGEKGTRQEIKELRQQLQQQQQELARALEKMAGGQPKGPQPLRQAHDWEEEQKLESLRTQLAEKDAEIQRLKAQESYALKLQEHFEDVQSELDHLREEMAEAEKKSWATAELTIELERAEQTQLTLESALHKKDEKLQDLTLENKELQLSLHELEKRFAETSRHQQQMAKKIQLLEELNADMMQMAETNRRLKTEVARIAELESMLQLLTQERQWLRK